MTKTRKTRRDPIPRAKRIAALDGGSMPHANLLIFKAPGTADINYISNALKLEPLINAAALELSAWSHFTGGAWTLSTGGFVTSPSLRTHIDWLLNVAIHGRDRAIRDLRNEGYWVSVLFHDTIRPDASALAWADAMLEQLGIAFDFELERD
jgi:hypothetical protein